MAMSFTVNYISGRPSYATRNRAQTLIPANVERVLWNPLLAPTIGEASTGSINCCTYVMPTAVNPTIEIGMEIVVNSIPVGTQFTIIGALRGNSLLQSGTVTVPSGTTTIPIINFQVFPNARNFPCRMAGDWTWSLNITGRPPIVNATTTRLELCMVKFSPPQGPLNPPNPATIARTDFGGEYPIDIFRLFLPPPEDLAGILASPLPNYLIRSMTVIWNLGLNPNPELGATRLFYYETLNGAPAYIDGYLGGTFQLTRFARGMFDSLNCYDLAGLAQAAACILQDDLGNDILSSRWIYCSPFGYINSGPLFGWPQYPTCNSPFFGNGKLPFYPPASTDRNSFGGHAWVEVVIPPNPLPLVLDATHCLQASPNAPSSGTQDRAVYLNGQTDNTRGPYSWLYASNPASRTSMIGLNGFGRVPFFLTELNSDKLGVQSDLVNNAPCDPQSLLQLVKGLLPNASIDMDDYVVSSKGCQAVVVFSGAFSNGHRLTLEVTDANSKPVAERHFQHQREQILNGVPKDFILDSSHLGENSVRLISSIAWLRNSTRIKIMVSAKCLEKNPQTTDTLLGLSKIIDNHFNTNAVSPPEQHRPASNLTGSKAVKVSVGDKFSINIGGLKNNLASVELSSKGIIQSLGPLNEAHEFEFYAVAAGKLTIKLCVAHRKTLALQILEVDVTVANKVVCHCETSLTGQENTLHPKLFGTRLFGA
ncbi:hypothetical protein TWF481_004940 [Arthrobotrys musiformis]|uniref:Uncharacterized protein n=1 Tax=Arthrobotrys musiformis TaxID=47236 RepID=A0AAV9WM63_9PEZI